MTKAKVANKQQLNNSKNNLHHPKDGSIHKKKQQKFKNTPIGKVSLINGTPSKLNGKQNSPKNGNGVMKSPKSPKSPKDSASSKKTPKGKKKQEEENEDSEEDFNEGISVNEIVSGQEDEEDDDDSSDEDAVPDVFKTTLPDATDESDADFDVTTAENKGVKMFRGVGKVNQEMEESNEEDDDDDEDDEDEDEEDEEDEDDKPVLGLSALLGDSIKDESGDEDFVGLENSEDDDDGDDDDDDEDESDEEIVDQSLNSSNVTSTDDDEEDDDDDDDEDEDEDNDEPTADLADLLGTSLADDSDDNDFEADDDDEDEDEDISNEEDDEEVPESKNKKEKKSTAESRKQTPEEIADQDKRTIFVGNLPKDVQVQALTKEFKKFGLIQCVRLRGIIPEDPKMPLKVAAIKKKFHRKSSTICAFIVYKDKESVQKALAMNGKKFQGNYLRVDRTERPNAGDKKKSVFLGNLPFTVEDNELWEAFKDCGRIESVRIIRHRQSGLGRGFGYINFETADGAVLALSLDGTEISNRKVRVTPCTSQEALKKQQQSPEKGGKRKHQSESESNDSPKKVKTDDSETERATHNSLNAERRKKKGNKRSQGDKQRAKATSTSPKSDNSPQKFQGQTGGAKNKKQKQDKTSKKKKQMAAKLLAKPKKPSAN